MSNWALLELGLTLETGLRLRLSLDEAMAALDQGDAVDAERRAKAVSALVRAQRDVAELTATPPRPAQEEDEEALRAELRGRIRRLVDAQLAGAPDDVLEQIARGGAAS